MKLNFKKILLTGTAIVAVSAFGSAAQAAELTVNDQTLADAALTGNTFITAADGKFANFDVNDTNPTVGAGAVNGLNFSHNSTIYVYDSNGDAVANTLTLTGTTNAINVANNKTVNFVIGQDQAGGNIVNDAIVTINANVVTGTNSAVIFTTKGAPGSVLNFTSGTINMGTNGGVVLTAAADTVTFANGAGAQTVTGRINGASAGVGVLNLNTTVANGGVTLNSAVGTANALAKVDVGAAGLAITAQDIRATTIELTDADSTLRLLGGTAKTQQIITGNIVGEASNTGDLVIGLANDAADVRVFGSIGTAAGTDLNTLTVASNSVLTVDSTQAARVVNVEGTLDANGTFNAYGENNVNVNTAAAVGDVDFDGRINTALHSARSTTTALGGASHTLTLGGAALNIGGDGVAASTTTINAQNAIVAANALTFGGNNGGVVNTVALEIGRNDFWHASNVNDGTALTVLNAGGNAVTIGNDAILRVRLADNDTYSFDNGDIVRVINSTGGTNLQTALTTGNAAGGLVIENTALVRLSAFGTDGVTWLATQGGGGTDDLTVRVVHQNPHNVLTNSHSANTAQAVMDLNDTNYGSRWGEQNEVNNAAAIAANGIGKGTLGQIQGNDASIAGGNALRAARNNLLTASTVDSATNIAESLSAVVDAGASQAALNVSNDTLKVAGDRLASLRGSETGMAAGNGGAGHRFWAQGFGTHASQDRRDGVDGYDADTYGFAVGLDTETISSNGILGVAFSYGDTDVDGDGGFGTNSNVDSYQITLYGDYDIDPATFVTGMLAYTWHDVDTTRHNVGALGVNATGDYDADQFSARASIGRDYLYDTMTVTPNLMAHWSHYDADGYTETGAGNASLNVDHDTINVFELGVGVEASWQHRTASGMDVEPSLHAGYRYDFVGDEVSTTNSFVGGGASFVTDGADPAQHAFNVGAGLDLYTTGNWEFKAAYDFDFRSDYTAHSGLVRAGVKF